MLHIINTAFEIIGIGTVLAFFALVALVRIAIHHDNVQRAEAAAKAPAFDQYYFDRMFEDKKRQNQFEEIHNDFE